jgi:tRNA pseudouridine38-40 synthase
MHDFAALSSKPAKEKSTRVLLEALSIVPEGELILIRVQASHFLWNMVRNLVGVLIEVGKGQLPDSLLAEALQQPDTPLTQHRAPAAGLFLEKVIY